MINTTGSVNLTFQNIYFDSNIATSTTNASGLIFINFTDTTQTPTTTQLTATLAFKNCVIKNTQGIGGTVIEIPNRVRTSSVVLNTVTLYNNIGSSSTTNGGAFRFLASTSNTVQVIGGSISQTTSGGNGTVFYMKGTDNTLQINNSASLMNNQGTNNNGGFVYMNGTGTQTLSLDNVGISTITSVYNGGFAYLYGQNVQVSITD